MMVEWDDDADDVVIIDSMMIDHMVIDRMRVDDMVAV